MWLFGKKKKSKPTFETATTNSMGESLDKLNAEGNLPFGWLAHNMQYVKPYENKIIELAVSLQPIKGSNRITLLKEIIKVYNEYKEYCYNRNECYKKHFQDNWEHCHNSRNKDFEYIEPYVNELKELETYETKTIKGLDGSVYTQDSDKQGWTANN